MTVIDTNTNCGQKIALLQQRQVTAVGRYYRVRNPSYRITKSEAQKLSAAGISIFIVYEDNGQKDAFNLTRAQGEADGNTAVQQAAGIGQPAGSAIYFALEGLPHGYKSTDLPEIRDYFAGVKAAVAGRFKLGVYSDGVVCKTLLDEGYCSYAWLSASTSFEGTTAFYNSGRWHLAQKTPLDQNWQGLSVDVNEAKADFGSFVVPFPKRKRKTASKKSRGRAAPNKAASKKKAAKKKTAKKKAVRKKKAIKQKRGAGKRKAARRK